MAVENTQNKGAVTNKLPQQFEIAVLPLQNTTLFPETVVPLAVGRERSMRAVESSLATEEKLLACVTTKSDDVTGDDAKYDDLYRIGFKPEFAGRKPSEWRELEVNLSIPPDVGSRFATKLDIRTRRGYFAVQSGTK